MGKLTDELKRGLRDLAKSCCVETLDIEYIMRMGGCGENDEDVAVQELSRSVPALLDEIEELQMRVTSPGDFPDPYAKSQWPPKSNEDAAREWQEYKPTVVNPAIESGPTQIRMSVEEFNALNLRLPKSDEDAARAESDRLATEYELYGVEVGHSPDKSKVEYVDEVLELAFLAGAKFARGQK